MYITKISCDIENPGVFYEAVRWVARLCQEFTCYGEEKVLICKDERQSATLLTKNLRGCGVDVDELYIKNIITPTMR